MAKNSKRVNLADYFVSNEIEMVEMAAAA